MDHAGQRILRPLARNGRLTNAELAKEAGLSASPCWTRRVSGTAGYEALLRQKLYRLPGVRHTRSACALRCLKRNLSPVLQGEEVSRQAGKGIPRIPSFLFGK